MAILERPTAAPVVITDEVEGRGLIERLPMFGLGVLVCLAVGYGFGTLVQFDNDWREAPPVPVTSVEGSLAQGESIEQAIEDLLAGSTTPVSEVQCPNAVDVLGDQQLCRARTPGGMVSVVATESQGLLSLQVHGPA